MMNRKNPAAGSSNERGIFPPTHWTNLFPGSAHYTVALQELFTQYREPMIVFVLARGYTRNRDEAEEVVQGFSAHLSQRNFLVKLSPQKGRLRSFLIASLVNYIRDLLDKEGAGIRNDGEKPASLDETDDDGNELRTSVSETAPPDLAFDIAWAKAVLHYSLQNLEKECASRGHIALWRALEPTLYADETSQSYHEIARQLGMTEGAVKVAAHRIRNRLRGLIREVVLQTVATPEDLEDEIQYLISLFGRSR